MFGIIGNGSWATALAKMLTDNGNTIHWWMRNESSVTHLLQKHHNPQYLTSVSFAADKIKPTTNLQAVLDASDILVFCVPSAFAMDILHAIPKDALKNKTVISAIKGILPEKYVLLNDYLASEFDFELDQYVAITGPCHAEEVAQERLSYLTFSGLDDAATIKCARAFGTDYIRTTSNHDLWGAQYAAVLKNIYAVGAGIAHGIGYGDNFLSVYNTNCYREMYRFLELQFEKVHPSNEVPDFHTSAYLGDLLVTCYSPHSRNRAFGTLIGKGYSVKAATTEMSMVAEGYFAVRGMKKIAAELNIEMPIMQWIHDTLWAQTLPAEAFKEIEKLLS
ncbi:glycerol-3-phosphate dehydrogenase [Taibaiella lutea]|uniref:Glycerol-3-phosphate dehydrogenase n=1 Tax=Taibaiella lutea TaxID=2608001 RepID=A0A5M6CQ00_9BACT|nr:NAD(P)H-dependent glycerol-3-phosphate dehydrogenase [Taibaiella lutea]KAA5537388.1 glycerol-3-phosphate dehydrogenase [Taibaiella lutea]